MWTEEDQKIAESAALTLARLQGQSGSGVVEQLKATSSQVANKHADEHERAEAWLSICHLIEALEKTPEASRVVGLWHRAIQATNAWRGSTSHSAVTKSE